MLRRVIPQSVPNPIPVLIQIRDKIIDIFEPQPGPPRPSDDLYRIDNPIVGEFNPEMPPEYKVDTIVKYDSLPKEDEDIFPNLKEEFRKKMDSVTPDKDSIKNELMKKQEEQLNKTFDKIVDKVNTALEPIRNALPKGDGGCNCLADVFTSFSVSLPMGGGFSVGSMIETSFICENIGVIRRIIMVIVGITCLGMILATLRR
jgi:hypothetical protein